MPRRKAQASQMFLTVLTLVIFVLVLIFGYKAVETFRAKSDDLLLLKFQKDLQTTLQSVSYGTMKIRTFEVPYGYHEFWLVDVTNAFDTDGNVVPSCTNSPPEILDAIQSRTGENAFLIGPSKFHAFTLTQISIGNGCLSTAVTNNQLQLKLSKG